MVEESFEWEKKSLDIDIKNIYLDPSDGEDIMEIIKSSNNKAFVVYIPDDCALLQEKLEAEGFSLVDKMTVFENKLEKIVRTSIQQRLYDVISVEKMDDADIELLKNEVDNGFFGSDWISKDQRLGNDISKKRYNAMIDDLWKNGTLFYKHIYKGIAIGFFTLTDIGEGIYESKLGGIFSKYRGSGLGTVVKVPEIVRLLGGQTVITGVMENNIEQHRNLKLNGYTVKSISKVYVRLN